MKNKLLPLVYSFLIVLSSVIAGPIAGVKTAYAVTPGERAVAFAKPASVIVVAIHSAYISWPWLNDYEYELELIGLGTLIYAQVGSYGSGFIINPNGYIVTTGHLVYDWQSDLAKYYFLLEDFVYTVVMADYYYGYALRNALGLSGYTLQEYYDTLLDWMVDDYLAPTPTYPKPSITEETVDVYVGIGIVVSGIDNLQGLLTATIRESWPAEKQDLALLKVTKSNMPTVLLGDSDTVGVGQTIYVLGYPGVVVENAYLDEERELEPTVTSGIVSGKTTTADGSPAIQTNAEVTYGNSGGMSINEEGEVIGVTTAMATRGGVQVAGFNFLRPSNLVKDLITGEGVTNEQGATDEAFQEGLTLYWDKHYSASIKKFQKVRDLFPEHPDAQNYITKAQAAIARGENVPLGGLFPTGLLLYICVAAVAAAAAAAVAGFFLLKRRRPKPKEVAPSPPPPPPPPSP